MPNFKIFYPAEIAKKKKKRLKKSRNPEEYLPSISLHVESCHLKFALAVFKMHAEML